MNKNNIESKLDNLKSYLESKDLDYYDIRLDDTTYSAIHIENKETKSVNNDNRLGIGIRVMVKGKIGFCSTNNLDNYKSIIDKCIEKTKRLTKKTKLDNFPSNKDKVKVKHKKHDEIDLKQKIKENINFNKQFLNQKHENKILNINTYQVENYTQRYFVSPYSYIYQEKPRTMFVSRILGKRNNIIETSHQSRGNVAGLEFITEKDKLENIEKSENELNELLISKPCPAVKTNVILDPSLVGVFAHEAIGHSSEADAILSNESTLKRGLIVSNNPEVNVIDNPTLNRFGNFKYDDEGVKAKKTHLIKDGVVKDHLTDIETATELGEKSNGSARVQSYDHIPIVRMSNTYFEKGSTKKQDILNDFSGYYLKKMIGGQVDTSVGTFTFGVGSVYEYRKGEIINRYKQASISGSIKDYLKNIIEVSKNKELPLTTGFCGKDGQSVPVSDGGPLLKLKKTVVGGTEHE